MISAGNQAIRAAKWRHLSFALIAVIAVLLALLLTACQSRPVVEEKVVEVVKPVAVRPIAPADVPSPPKPLGPRPQSPSAAADTLLSKWCAAVAYVLRADPLLRVSAGLPPIELARYPECER